MFSRPTIRPGTSKPMDQTHSTIWIFILSFINTSLPGSLSTPLFFFSFYSFPKDPYHTSVLAGHTRFQEYSSQQRERCVKATLHSSGGEQRVSTWSWELGTFVVIKGDPHFMASLPGPSGRWWQLQDRHISKTRKHSYIVTVPRSQGYIHKTFPDYWTGPQEGAIWMILCWQLLQTQLKGKECSWTPKHF